MTDTDCPRLEPSGTGIEPSGSKIYIGGGFVSVPAHAVPDSLKVDLSYDIDITAPPDGFIRASSLLSCEPKLVVRKRKMEVMLPLFCYTEKSVPVSLCSKDEEGQWNRLNEEILDTDGKIYLSVERFTNAAAFVPKDRIDDVMFSVACMLFKNPEGKFAMGFCLNDEAIKNLFCHRIRKQGFDKIQKVNDIIHVAIGDEIKFCNTSGQVKPNSMAVNENFVSGFQGHVSHCTVSSANVNLSYDVIVSRKGLQIRQLSYNIPLNNSSKLPSDILGILGQGNGNVDIDNIFGHVKHAKIDQRSHGDDSCACDPHKGLSGSSKIGNYFKSVEYLDLDQRRLKKKPTKKGSSVPQKNFRGIEEIAPNSSSVATQPQVDSTASPIHENFEQQRTRVEASSVTQDSQQQTNGVPSQENWEEQTEQETKIKEPERKSEEPQESYQSCCSDSLNIDEKGDPVHDDSIREKSFNGRKNAKIERNSSFFAFDTRHYFMFGIIVLLLAYIYSINTKR